MSFLSDYTEKNSNLIPQIDIPCFAWNSQAEQGFLFFKAKSLTFEDLAVDFEGTTASGAKRFYRRTLDKLCLKLLESRLVHTVTLKQTECRKRNKK